MENQNFGPLVPKQERNWGMAAHLIALIGFLGIPFGNLLGPLVIWLIFRKDYAFVDAQGKESLNFQLTVMIYGFAAALLIVILVGIPILFMLVIFDIVFVVIAAVKISNGEEFTYPWTLRLIK